MKKLSHIFSTNFVSRPLKRIMYRLMAARYIKNIKVDIDPSKKTILVLNHFYDQDVAALVKGNDEYNLIIVKSPILFKGAKIFFCEDVRELLNNYYSEPEENRNQYNNECKYIFNKLNNKFNIKLIVTASDIFYWIREFIVVANSQDVKTVVLDKEGLISPHDFDAEAERIRSYSPFISDHIYVWSERQRKFWNKIGVDDEKITVIGQSRSDLFFHEVDYVVDEFFNNHLPIVTFFTYEDTAYIPMKMVEAEGVSWKVMKTQTQDLLYELAKKHKNYNFVFKAHPQQTDLMELKEKYELENLRVLGGAEIANELILRSKLIVAFQTTAILEAMFMDKKIIYTSWDDNISSLIDYILPFDTAKGIEIAKSYDSFREMCKRFFQDDCTIFNYSDHEKKLKNEMISYYLYRPDGKVCRRFFNGISHYFDK